MSLLSDEELAKALGILEDRGPGVYWSLIDKMTGAIRDHIDALAAQLERTRNMVVALEQELANPDGDDLDKLRAEVEADPVALAAYREARLRDRLPIADRTLDALLGRS